MFVRTERGDGGVHWSSLHLDDPLCRPPLDHHPPLLSHLLLLLLSKVKEDQHGKHVTQIGKQPARRPQPAGPGGGGAGLDLQQVLLHLQPKTPPMRKRSPRRQKLSRIPRVWHSWSFQVCALPHVRSRVLSDVRSRVFQVSSPAPCC